MLIADGGQPDGVYFPSILCGMSRFDGIRPIRDVKIKAQYI